MNGEIGVHSSLGQGSVFWFEVTVPLSTSDPAGERPAQKSLRLEHRAMNILVVDDIEPNRSLTATVLRNAGHRVITAAGGHEAIEFATAEKFDVILMDMQMPGMNGLIATKEIRKLSGRDAVPIVAMTANVLPKEIASCYAAGMTAHIGKPFEIDELLSIVETVGAPSTSELRDFLQRRQLSGQA
jgi:CheY-like chemotaxis protein